MKSKVQPTSLKTLLTNRKVCEKLSPSPENRIRSRVLSMQEGKDYDERLNSKKRKSFGDFIENAGYESWYSLHSKNTKNFNSLVVSYDHKVIPIHFKLKAPITQLFQNYRIPIQNINIPARSSINPKKPQVDVSAQRNVRRSVLTLDKDETIRLSKKPLMRKHLRIRTDNDQNQKEQKNRIFINGPWSKRGERADNIGMDHQQEQPLFFQTGK